MQRRSLARKLRVVYRNLFFKFSRGLTDDVSPWGSDVYIAVDRDVPDHEVVEISGRFFTRVFSGPARKINRWKAEMEDAVRTRGFAMRKLYSYYPTCPKCARKFGQNDVVLVAQLGLPG